MCKFNSFTFRFTNCRLFVFFKKIGKIFFVVLLYYALYKCLLGKEGCQEALYCFSKLNDEALILVFVVVLMIIPNWMLEALKWQIALSEVEKKTYLESLLGVLRAIPFALFTPNRVGETIGRAAFLKKTNRIAGVAASSYCGLAQMVVMLFASWVACLWFCLNHIAFAMSIDFVTSSWFICLNGVCFIVGLLLFVYPLFFVGVFKKFNIFVGLIAKLSFFSNYNRRLKSVILCVSLFRYIVYVVQNILLLNAFGIDIAFIDGFMSVVLIYALMSFVPRPALAEFGVRCSVSIFVLSSYTSDYPSLAASSVLLWIINLLFPCFLAGTTYLLPNIFANEKEK